MAIKLVINRIVLPRQIVQLPNAIPIPITLSGGTNEAAIATQASQAHIFLYHRARKATNHEAKAIHRSTKVGSVLIAISLVTSVRGMSRVNKIAITTQDKILRISKMRDLLNSF